MSSMTNMAPFDLAMLLSTVAGLGVLLLFLGLQLVTGRDVDLSERLAGWGESQPHATVLASGERVSVSSRIEMAVGRRSFAGSIQRDLARANLRLTVSEYLLITVAAVGVGLLVGTIAANVAMGLALGILGFYAPRFFITIKQKRRLKAFGGQLADTLLLMSNSLRAGYSLLQSMETVARDAPEPSREEFARVVREVGLGLSPEEALINLHRRMPSEDLDLMVTAINVQHEVGGNLAKIFDTLAETIRERNRIMGEVATLTAQQRMGGHVVALLPLGMAGIVNLISPGYLAPLFSSEQVVCMPAFGLPILGLIMMAAGYYAIRRIVAIEV